MNENVGLRLRPAKPEDRDALHAIAKETPRLTFPEDVLAWPTIECAVVETEEGEIVGFGYIEAIPECHFVMRRGGVPRDTKKHAISLLHYGVMKLAESLDLPTMRYPVSPDLPNLTSWIAWLLGFPTIRLDPRVHLAMFRMKGD